MFGVGGRYRPITAYIIPDSLTQTAHTVHMLQLQPGGNIFQNSPRIIREKFPNFLGSGEKFYEIQFCVCFCDLGWGSVNNLEGKLF